jgi:hypothetical protein
MYHDESGVSVIIGTLMLILITITAASGLALMVSGMQKEAMDRESHLAAVASENMRIIAIESVENFTDFTQWDSVNVTLMNLNTADSRITAISLNGDHARNYMAKGASGDLDCDKSGNLVVYNFNKRCIVPAAGSKEICLNFTEIVINSSEDIEDLDKHWTDTVNNSDPYPLQNHPNVTYPHVLYPNREWDWTNLIIYNVTSPSNITVVPESGNYTINDTTGGITFNGTNNSGTMSNTSSYSITYHTIQFDTFPPPGSMSVSKNKHITIEVITSLINIFKRTFMPPVPLAEVQVKSERRDPNGTASYQDYLILDASESFDPDDGFITEYQWYVWGNNSTSAYIQENLTGMKVRPVKLNLTTSPNIEIDLQVRDDTGMVSKLSLRSGNITIP